MKTEPMMDALMPSSDIPQKDCTSSLSENQETMPRTEIYSASDIGDRRKRKQSLNNSDDFDQIGQICTKSRKIEGNGNEETSNPRE